MYFLHCDWLLSMSFLHCDWLLSMYFLHCDWLLMYFLHCDWLTPCSIPQELQDEQDVLNSESTNVCGGMLNLQEKVDSLQQELVSQTALLDTATGMCGDDVIIIHNIAIILDTL